MADKANGATPVSAPKKGMTKMEAVRRAIAHFGNTAKPSEMQPWIKQQFGIEMSPNHISASRGDIQRKNKLAVKVKAGRKPAVPKATAKKPAPKLPAITQAAPATSGDIRLEDIEVVKGLVHRVGVDQLRALVDLLAK
jgi:hypothetical protein